MSTSLQQPHGRRQECIRELPECKKPKRAQHQNRQTGSVWRGSQNPQTSPCSCIEHIHPTRRVHEISRYPVPKIAKGKGMPTASRRFAAAVEFNAMLLYFSEILMKRCVFFVSVSVSPALLLSQVHSLIPNHPSASSPLPHVYSTSDRQRVGTVERRAASPDLFRVASWQTEQILSESGFVEEPCQGQFAFPPIATPIATSVP